MNNMMNNMMMPNLNDTDPNNNEILDLINQNIQMTDQIAMNNNLIKSKIENSNSGYNNINNDKLEELYGIDFFPLRKGSRINVIFKDSSGITINIVTPSDVTIIELLEAFYIKLQIYGKINNKIIEPLRNYFFIYRGQKISFNEKKTINEYGLTCNVEQIIFNSNNDIIGG